MRIETRSGNLAKPTRRLGRPGAAWRALTPWPSTGEPGATLRLRPRAICKSGLRSPSDRCCVTDFYHQPLNQRPRITEVTVGEDPHRSQKARGVRPPRTSDRGARR